jgi:DNA-directed RNA polymerase subunit RPC12/RpoP
MAIYECRHCEREVLIPRHYSYHLGGTCRCPKCGTFRVVKLKVPDKIDPMQGGVLNLVERLAGGNLYHCCYCRVQFFDRRPIDPNASRVAVRPEGAPSHTQTREELAADEEMESEAEVHPEVAQDRVTSRGDKASSGQ